MARCGVAWRGRRPSTQRAPSHPPGTTPHGLTGRLGLATHERGHPRLHRARPPSRGACPDPLPTLLLTHSPATGRQEGHQPSDKGQRRQGLARRAAGVTCQNKIGAGGVRVKELSVIVHWQQLVRARCSAWRCGGRKLHTHCCSGPQSPAAQKYGPLSCGSKGGASPSFSAEPRPKCAQLSRPAPPWPRSSVDLTWMLCGRRRLQACHRCCRCWGGTRSGLPGG